MRVLIAWADNNSTNLGVRALARGASALVSKIWPTASVEFQSFGPGASPVPINDRALLKDRAPWERRVGDWLSEYDLMLDMRAGDSFADIYGVRRLVTMNAFASAARRVGVPVVFGPQTIGPFRTPVGRKLGEHALKQASVVIARDAVSAEYSSQLNRDVDAVSTDVVFAIDRPHVEKSVDVAINVSGLLWSPNPHVDAQKYQDDMSRVCKRLAHEGRKITLFAHVLDSPDPDNDVPALRRFANMTDVEMECFIPSSLDAVRTFVASANVVVGARMHACLNALSVGTPAIPLAYSRKFSPLLEDLGWNWTLDLNETGDLSNEVVRLIDSSRSGLDMPMLESRASELLDAGAHAIKRAVE